MNQALKRRSLKFLLPWMVLCVLLAAALLGVSGKGVLGLAAGPRPLQTQVDQSNALNGSYVSLDASEVIVAFATLTSSSDSEEKTLETYYLWHAGDGRYLAIVDKKEHNQALLDRAMEQSHEFYLGDLTELTALGTLSGTASSLDEDMIDFMTDCIQQYQLPGYDGNLEILPIEVTLDRVGLFGKTLTLVLFALGLVLLLCAAALLLWVLLGGFQKKANRFIAQWHTPQEAEAIYEAAAEIERIRVGAYIWYQKGAVTKVLKTDQLIWGYQETEPLVVSKYRWPVALFNEARKKTILSFMEKKNCQALLDTIAAQGGPFIGEQSPQIAQIFFNDMDAFMALAEEQAKTHQL